ncbi:hypothetical protein EAH87_10485 [Sphingomonas koreensis]|nr:hypothetical protein EAH87_10485 [Sphingomonas koreensis]
MASSSGEYRTSIDRAGWAIAVGALLCGAASMLLVVRGGDATFHAAAVALLLGSLFAALAIAAVGGPVWLAMHAIGWRGPAHAAAAGAIVGFVLVLAAHLSAGLDGDPLRLAQALGAALIAAALTGAIALVMWRIAYWRVG